MNIFTHILIKLIKIYKFLISPLLGQSCRYMPTCSEYSIEALKTFGFIKGSFLSLKRILSCHPVKILGGGEGFDPVNKNLDQLIKKYVENERMVRLDQQLQSTMVQMKEKFEVMAGNTTSAKAVHKRM